MRDHLLTRTKAGVYTRLLAFSTVLVLAGCGGTDSADAGGSPDNTAAGKFPVNESLAVQLTSKGLPSDVARFFASARLESSCPTESTCTYLQTYPNGASREITLTATPKLQYTPTADELASDFAGIPLYQLRYVTKALEDSSAQVDLSYFVPKTAIPDSPTKVAAVADRAKRSEMRAGPGPVDGFTINWKETAKTGGDVAIGSIIDRAADKGVRGMGSLGSIYTLAGAASSVSDSLEVSKQTSAWLAELDSLEKCAANPTDPLARKDPNYSPAAVAKVQSVRTEIKSNSAVMFLSRVDEVAMGLHKVLAVLSVPLKPVFSWNEEVFIEVSERAMREARLAVISCGGVWSGSTSVVISDSAPVYKLRANVTWVLNSSKSTRLVAVYNPEGTLSIEPLLAGLAIAPSTYTITHADGELRIDMSTTPPTYTGTTSTQPWPATWIAIDRSYPGTAGGAWFFGDGSTSMGGTEIAGTKKSGDITFTYSFNRR